jgi:hypothetical protein
VTGQPAELGLLQHDVSLAGPLRQDSDDEWTASVRLRVQEFDTAAVLPNTGDPFPGTLWHPRVNTMYRHRFASRWIAGGILGVGSPSDRPFDSMDEMELTVTGFLRIPVRERDAWLLLLNYSSNREFLNHIPLPGLGYSYEPSEAFSLLIGTGFASLQYRPTDKLTLMATYTPVRTVDTRITYQIFRPVRLWAGFDWTNERYFRADRPDPDDRLFYYEKRVRVGATVGLARQLYVDVAVGYSFDRFYFEGEGYDERGRNRVSVDDGPFVAARLGLRF